MPFPHLQPHRLLAGAVLMAAPCLAFTALAQDANPPASGHRATTASEPAPAVATASGAPEQPGPSERNSTELRPIVVTSVPLTADYGWSQTSTATGTDTPIIDVPQSIQVIPRQVLRDQASQSLADAIRNAPGVYVQQGEGNRDEFYIRGVKTKSDFFTDGLRDDTEYFRDLYNIEHIDVLQGPAAILFGRGGAGGIINLVTKQPQRRRIRHLEVEGGSWDHLRSTVDVGDSIGAAGAFRLMAMAENSGNFRDHDYVHRYAINPKFRFNLGTDTQLDLGFSYLNDHRFDDRGIPSRNGRPADVPRDRFFGSVNQNVARARVEAFNARITHRFNDHLQVRNAFLMTENKRMYRNAYAASPIDDDDNLKLKAYEHPNERLSYLDRAELVADFATGALQHTLVLGSEYSWQRGKDLENLPGPSKTLPGKFPASDPTVANVLFPYLERDNHVVGKEFGVYAEDQMSLGEHWKALVGARWSRFTVDANYRKPGVSPDHTHNVDTNWSPRAGIIYKPVENDSFYTSVTQTYTPQGANIALSRKSPKGADLAPEKATNYEVGNKLDLLDGNLSLTAALFQLNLENVVSKAADGSGALVNTGKQRNRGFELSAAGALTSEWSVYANYTRLDAEITKATKDAAAGARVGLVPRNQFSVWTRYALTPNWGIAAGVRGASQKYTSYDNDVVLPAFAVGDVMVYYQADTYRVQINVDNVTDKHYYPTASGDNQIMPGAPRSVKVSLRLHF